MSKQIKIVAIHLQLVAAICLIFVLALAASLSRPAIPSGAHTVQPPPLVVIDPGHGGYDRGAEREGVFESHINLDIALELREVLLAAGYRVVLTRYGDYSLVELDEVSGPKKREDFMRRLGIVEKHQPDVIISIHCNAFGSSRWYGAQTFYQEGEEYDQGKLLAQSIQSMLAQLTDTYREAKPTDFFLARESDRAGCVVECGFLSNPAERQLLLQPGYQRRLAAAIWLGIEDFLRHPDRER